MIPRSLGIDFQLGFAFSENKVFEQQQKNCKTLFNKWQFLRKLQEVRQDKQVSVKRTGSVEHIQCMLFMEHMSDFKLKRKTFGEEQKHETKKQA